ncbi:MAG: type II toxin-antitoxin system VapB family antitoxin [Balneolales bacterium]
MRDIPEKELKEAMKYSGAKIKREAILVALQEFNRRKRAEEAVKIFGTFSSIVTNEEIEVSLF